MKLRKIKYYFVCTCLLFTIIYPIKAEVSNKNELNVENSSIDMTLSPQTSELPIELIKGIPEKSQNRIKLIYPSNDLVTFEKSILIKGLNNFLTATFVNGKPVRIRKDGRFFYNHTLPSFPSKSSIWITWITTENNVVIEQRKIISLKTFKEKKNKINNLSILINSPYFSSKKAPSLTDPVTRAEFATLMAIIIAEKIPVYSDCAVFEDVSQDYWASGPISFMASKTYLLEYSDGKFHPDGPIKKLDYIISIARLLHLNLEIKPGVIPYSDINPSHWSIKFVRAMYQNKLLPEDKKLNSQSILTWAELEKLVTLIPHLENQVTQLTDFSTGFGLSLKEAESRIKPALSLAKETAIHPIPKKVEILAKNTSPKTDLASITYYEDTKGHWIELTAEKLKKSKILDFGTQFQPEKIVTKKEAYQIFSTIKSQETLSTIYLDSPINRISVLEMINAFNLIPENSPRDISKLFRDMKKNKHTKALIEKAYSANLITGEKYFHPTQLVTRAELATMISHFTQVRKKLELENK